jgi:hypothetical protein
MTRMNLSQRPRLGSNTRPPLYLSLLLLDFLPPSPSSSFCSALIRVSTFFPHCLSGQIYLRRWNSCRRMYSLRSARPPLSVLFLYDILACYTTELINRAVPRVSGQIRQLSRQWKNLNLRSKGHLIMCVEFTVADKRHQSFRITDAPVKIARGIVRVNVLSVTV